MLCVKKQSRVILVPMLSLVLFFLFLARPSFVEAQTLTAEQRATLQAEYDQLQTEIAQWQKVLDETKTKKNTLTGDVTTLDAQIKKAQKEIQQRNITITTIGSEITQKTAAIKTLEQRIVANKESLAELIRKKNEVESRSFALLVLSAGSLSNFFGDVEDIDTINGELQDLFATLRQIKSVAQNDKEVLDAKKNAELDARHSVEVKQGQIKDNQAEKKKLLEVAKKDERAYGVVLADRQKRATEIRNALFALRDSAGISFEAALAYSNAAQAATGVRAAFILGILRQESNLGTNVGQCYLTDPKTGTGVGKNTGRVFQNTMHPTRDVPPFLALMERLGGDPYKQVVSCPQSIGYGGAMGPSQFIASTWKIYEEKLAIALGVAIADPWRASDAVMATALFMKDLGAGAQTYSAEREAAARYYAGGNWQKNGLGYAASVLAFADAYQKDINFLNNN